MRRMFAALLAAMMLLTGCTDEPPREEVRGNAALEYRFYTIADALAGMGSNEALTNRLSSDYDTLLGSRRTQLSAALQPNKTEPLNRVPADPVLPITRYCPTASLLYETERAPMNMNPVLVMRQILSAMPETAVQESESTRSETKEALSSAPEGSYTAAAGFISSCLKKYYCDMNWQVGYSEAEDLYYVYIFDAREQLRVLSLYFRFDKKGTLGGIGFDCILYNPYEITLLEDTYLPLVVPEEPECCRLLKSMSLAMLGAKHVDLSAVAPLAQQGREAGSCVHTHEVQYYYAGETGADHLLAMRTMDWYSCEVEKTEES